MLLAYTSSMRVSAGPAGGGSVRGRPGAGKPRSRSTPNARERQRSPAPGLIRRAPPRASAIRGRADHDQPSGEQFLAEAHEVLLDPVHRLLELLSERGDGEVDPLEALERLQHPARRRVQPVVLTRLDVQQHRLRHEVAENDMPGDRHDAVGDAFAEGLIHSHYQYSMIVPRRCAVRSASWSAPNPTG